MYLQFIIFFMALSLWQIIYGAILYFHSTQSLVCSILLKTCFPVTKEKLIRYFSETKFQDFFRTQIDFSSTWKFTLTLLLSRSQY